MKTIHRRTFEAEKFPKGSPEREALNLQSLTSEYMHSYKYEVHEEGSTFVRTFRTKSEAVNAIETYEQNGGIFYARYDTTDGNKTALGLYRSIIRSIFTDQS